MPLPGHILLWPDKSIKWGTKYRWTKQCFHPVYTKEYKYKKYNNKQSSKVVQINKTTYPYMLECRRKQDSITHSDMPLIHLVVHANGCSVNLFLRNIWKEKKNRLLGFVWLGYLEGVVHRALIAIICDDNPRGPWTLGATFDNTVEVSGQCHPRVQPIYW